MSFMETNLTVRAALYARVSTEEQAELGYSIDAQIDTIRKFCSKQGTIVVDEYVDRGVSGKSIEGRHALQRMLKDAKENKFDIIYIWKISRLARKNVDLLTIAEELGKHNVKLYSISENFDTDTTMGKFSLQMMGAVAEFERNTIVENVKLGMRQRARKGKWNGGVVLGYRSLKSIKTSLNQEESTLVIVPEEAVRIRKIFELYASGKGLKSIANQINHEGYRTKRGNTFSTDSIKEIILNPIYIGKIRFNRHENWSERRRKGKSEDVILEDGKHEPIIDIGLWNKVQLIQNHKSKRATKNYDGKFLLIGLIKCPMCGASMVSNRTVNKLKDGSKKVLRYYSCGAFRSKGSSVCRSNSIRADYAEKYVLERLEHVVKHPTVLKEIVKTVNKKKKGNVKPLQEELNSLTSIIEEINDRRDKYLKLYENSLIDQSMIIDRLNEIREERDSLLKRQADIVKELASSTTQELDSVFVREVLEQFYQLIEMASFEQQKMLLQLIIREIKINEDKEIEYIDLQINQQLQAEIMQQAPSEKQLDGAFSICISI